MHPEDMVNVWSREKIAKIKSTSRTFIGKKTGENVTEHKLELSFFRKEEVLKLAYQHLGLDNLKDKGDNKELERMLLNAQKRVKAGQTFGRAGGVCVLTILRESFIENEKIY
ncbi:hypothetical protein ACFL5K_04155 [Gemmatimonadota bacterium]